MNRDKTAKGNSPDPRKRAQSIIDVDNLSVHFHLEEGTLKAVDRISFSIAERQMFGPNRGKWLR